MIKRIVGMYYSPTGETANMTERLVEYILAGLCDDVRSDISVECFDIRDADNLPELDNETLAIIGMPVHVGKIPLPAIKALKKVAGGKAMTIGIVSFSGRSYGNALYELKEYCSDRGFIPIGAGAFVLYAGPRRRQSPEGEPAMDIRTMSEFAKAASAKVERLGGCEIEGLQIKPAPLEVKGKMPIHKISKISPKAAAIAQNAMDKLAFGRRESEWFL